MIRTVGFSPLETRSLVIAPGTYGSWWCHLYMLFMFCAHLGSVCQVWWPVVSDSVSPGWWPRSSTDPSSSPPGELITPDNTSCNDLRKTEMGQMMNSAETQLLSKHTFQNSSGLLFTGVQWDIVTSTVRKYSWLDGHCVTCDWAATRVSRWWLSVK